jgi:tetratricopeptide (TPR) repeat protein
VTFSPNGQRLVLSTGGDGGIALWDTSTRQELMTLSSPSSIIRDVQFTGDGNTILIAPRAAGSGGGDACQFWHAPSWQEIEDTERIGGRWPQTEAFQPPPPAPTLGELKVFLEKEYREKLAEARSQLPEESERVDAALENLANFLRHQHRDAEAETRFRELLERLKNRTPPDDIAVRTVTINLLGVTLSQLHAEGDAVDLQRSKPLSDQADALVNDVIELLTQRAAASPKDTFRLLTVGMFQIWFDRKADHVATLRRLLEHAEQNPENAEAMEHAALAWCLSPTDDPALRTRVLDLAQRAANQASGSWQEGWYHRTLGLAHYRLSHYAEAEQALDHALKAADGFQGTERKYRQHLQTSVLLIRSMIRRHSGNDTAAREYFVQGKSAMKRLPVDPRLVFEGPTPVDDVLVWLAYWEAEKELKEILEVPH